MRVSKRDLKIIIENYLFEQEDALAGLDAEESDDTDDSAETEEPAEDTETEEPAEEEPAEEKPQAPEMPEETDTFTIEVEGQKKSVQFRKVTAKDKQGEKKEKLVPFIDGKPFKPRGGNPTVLDTIVLAAYGLLSDSLSEETRGILEKIVTKQAISGFFKGSSGGALVSKIERVIELARPGSGFEKGYLAKRLGLI